MLQLLVFGMVVAARTLREVEELGPKLVRGSWLPRRKTPSDNTLERVVRLMDATPLLAALAKQVLRMHRSKQLAVLPEVGISLVAVDGKAIGTDPVRLHPEAQAQGANGTGPFVLRVLRAVHVASEVKPALAQRMIPGKHGEANNFVPFVESLVAAYGKTGLLECFSVDAGFTSRSNMHWLNDHDFGFIAALKGDQPTLYGLARRWLGSDEVTPPGGWEVVVEDRSGSRHVTRFFARCRDLGGGAHDWTCIRQVWRVRQRVEKGGKVTFEDRYFVVNLPWGRLSSHQCLRAVRAHWGIENNSNWTLDVVWGEDSWAWVRQGRALEILAVLRLMAYNIVRLLRCRVLRGTDTRGMPYRSLLRLIVEVLLQTAPNDACSGAEPPEPFP